MAMQRTLFSPVHAIPAEWTVVKTGTLTSALWTQMDLWMSTAEACGQFAVFPARMLAPPERNEPLRGATAWGFSDPAMAVEFKLRFG